MEREGKEENDKPNRISRRISERKSQSYDKDKIEKWLLLWKCLRLMGSDICKLEIAMVQILLNLILVRVES